MGPWPNSWFEGPHAPAPSPEEGPWTWESLAQSQQRWWAQWTEAGQTWLQWWLSSVPQVAWPPVGVIIEPSPLEAPPVTIDAILRAPVPAREARPGRARKAPSAKRRESHHGVSGARHH